MDQHVGTFCENYFPLEYRNDITPFQWQQANSDVAFITNIDRYPDWSFKVYDTSKTCLDVKKFSFRDPDWHSAFPGASQDEIPLILFYGHIWVTQLHTPKFVGNFLSDPGIPEVRSMGPSVSKSNTLLRLN